MFRVGGKPCVVSRRGVIAQTMKSRPEYRGGIFYCGVSLVARPQGRLPEAGKYGMLGKTTEGRGAR